MKKLIYILSILISSSTLAQESQIPECFRKMIQENPECQGLYLAEIEGDTLYYLKTPPPKGADMINVALFYDSNCQQVNSSASGGITGRPKGYKPFKIVKALWEKAKLSTEDEAVSAQTWLTKSIVEYFSVQELDSLEIIMRNITTPDYYAYKGDATNVDTDTDGALTEQQFHDKWKDKFDTSKAGIGFGFLITGQDWGKISVSKCMLLSKKNSEYMFDVVMEDSELQEVYPISVKVIPTGSSFLIADVLQGYVESPHP